MSSQDEAIDANQTGMPLKKKKRGRACDTCRQRKVRCDGIIRIGQRCAYCAAGGYECTYVGSAKKRYPDVAYVDDLEAQLTNMKKLLNKLHPGVDFSDELNNINNTNLRWVEPAIAEQPAEPWNRPPAASTSMSTFPLSPVPLSSTDTPPQDLHADSSDEEYPKDAVFRKLSEAWRNRAGGRRKFLGNSGRYVFLRKVFDYRSLYAEKSEAAPVDWAPRYSGCFDRKNWLMPPLEDKTCYSADCFPPAELMTELISHYFDRYNLGIPVLHRPTFDNHLKNGLHLEDEGFGGVVLLVCAIGSRFSFDKRVLVDRELASDGEEQKTWQSAGWKWFSKVQTSQRAMSMSTPRLFDLQIFCLASIYLYGSFTQPAWALAGIGLRLAQDLGAHRKKTYERTPNAEDEQLKRVFWALLVVDRVLSSGLGRPCCIQDEDFDLDLPIECDDEYWTNPDPALAFKQPPGKPSIIAFFNCYIRLKDIHAYALRTLYATNREKVARGHGGSEWEQNVVSELDSALNSFVDSIPDHLRWDPHRENMAHLMQSAILYSGYYAMQINVHRPFIPSPRKPSRLSFPSLAICTNAARSCIHILDVHAQRTHQQLVYSSQSVMFTSGIVLLLNIWGGKVSGALTDPAKEMAEVHKAMSMLKDLEPRFFSAGRYWDVLYHLASVGDLPLPEPAPSNKRPRAESTSEVAGQDLRSMVEEPGNPRPIAGSKRVQAYQQEHSEALTPNPAASSEDFVLPLHSADLGRLPLRLFAAGAPDFQPNGWYAPSQTGMHDQTQILSAQAMQDSTLPSMFNEAFDVQNSAAMPASNGLDFGVGVVPPQVPNMFMPSSAGAHDNTIENMMASVSMEPTMMPDLSEDDTLAMWYNAPPGFRWDDWGSFLSTFGQEELTNTED